MDNLNLGDKHRNAVNKFTDSLKNIYGDGLVAVFLYGSAASGEFVKQDSDLNLLVVLNRAEPQDLKKASKLVRGAGRINPLFLSKDHILRSLDVFPIEFLDMQENHALIYGTDILKDVSIDIRHLRFQCEQELKEKLINLKQAYLKSSHQPKILRRLLFEAFNPVLHVARNLLRLKGHKAPYLKEDILKELSEKFKINAAGWQKMLTAKNNRIKISASEAEELFIGFLKGLEELADIADKL